MIRKSVTLVIGIRMYMNFSRDQTGFEIQRTPNMKCLKSQNRRRFWYQIRHKFCLRYVYFTIWENTSKN